MTIRQLERMHACIGEETVSGIVDKMYPDGAPKNIPAEDIFETDKMEPAEKIWVLLRGKYIKNSFIRSGVGNYFMKKVINNPIVIEDMVKSEDAKNVDILSSGVSVSIMMAQRPDFDRLRKARTESMDAINENTADFMKAAAALTHFSAPWAAIWCFEFLRDAVIDRKKEALEQLEVVKEMYDAQEVLS